MQNEVNLCKSCNTAKHLNQEGLCGRCAPEPELNVEAAVRDILRLRVLGELNHMVWATTDQKVDAMLALLQQVSDQRVKALGPYLRHDTGCWPNNSDVIKNDCECGLFKLSPLTPDEQKEMLERSS